jgi:pullulanase/glycogen debranching enzyme
VLALRRQQVENFFCLLMLSNGTPMFCAGDEFLNTQGGNNNPYNQDNETTWLDWSKLEQNRDIFDFFQREASFASALTVVKKFPGADDGIGLALERLRAPVSIHEHVNAPLGVAIRQVTC